MLVVVIPTKNRRALLERALGSIWAQTYPDYRVVVINDGSTDGTREYLDALSNPRIQVVHHERSRGVNTARNVGLRTLKEGEWALLIDDDEMFFPNAFEVIAKNIAEVPSDVQVLSFNTVMRGVGGDYPGGYRFAEEQKYYEPRYNAFMTDIGLDMYANSENRAAFKWTLFPKYLAREDINGFEREMWIKLSHDGIRIRYVPPVTVLIDIGHTGEHLSYTASARNPHSFARAHWRILTYHHTFYAEHPRYAKREALHSFKVAVRALAPFLALYFLFEYLRASIRSLYIKDSKSEL